MPVSLVATIDIGALDGDASQPLDLLELAGQAMAS